MKKILLTLFVAASLISCSKDDDGAQASQVSFGDSAFTIQTTNAFIYDYGDDGTHYNKDFSIQGTLDGKEAELYLELYSLGDVFATGAFQEEYSDTASFFYVDLGVTTPGTNGGSDTVDYHYSVSGTITVTKIEGNVYTFNINVVLRKEGAEVENNFNGTIEIAVTDSPI